MRRKARKKNQWKSNNNVKKRKVKRDYAVKNYNMKSNGGIMALIYFNAAIDYGIYI